MGMMYVANQQKIAAKRSVHDAQQQVQCKLWMLQEMAANNSVYEAQQQVQCRQQIRQENSSNGSFYGAQEQVQCRLRMLQKYIDIKQNLQPSRNALPMSHAHAPARGPKHS